MPLLRFSLILSTLLAVTAGCGGSEFGTTGGGGKPDASSGGGSGGSSGSAGAAAGSAGASGAGGAAVDGSTGGAATVDSSAPDVVTHDAGGCPPGEKLCGTDCVSFENPETGCGGPSCEPCEFPNAIADCFAGACSIENCEGSHADCNGDPNDGCEVDLGVDLGNCGACGSPCSPPNATPVCSNGKCKIGDCEPGLADCDGSPDTGCETNTQSDPEACGGCGNDCTESPGVWVCDAGLCTISMCPAGTAECDNDPSTVCETNVDGDIQNCGFCGNKCSLPNATPVCKMGKCAVEGCNPPFLDCDGAPENGCEVDPTTDTANCGGCGRACAKHNAQTVRCNGRLCDSTCTGSAGNCTLPSFPSPDDGCETDLATDPNHCGDCGRPCKLTNVALGGRRCTGGLCTPACDAGYGDCTRPPAPGADDGCETRTDDDPFNCGACGRACSALNTVSLDCSGGLCTSFCKLGSGNCNLPGPPSPDDGCETPTDRDDLNCGGCGNACQPGLACGASDDNLCGCSNTGMAGEPQCVAGGIATPGAMCGNGGICSCDGQTCAPGEYCETPPTSQPKCSCNGDTVCAPGATCCQKPAGCFDLSSDPNSCGACGRACPPGFDCAGDQCLCVPAAGGSPCNAGSSGACGLNGLCICGVGKVCNEGERCLPGGVCG